MKKLMQVDCDPLTKAQREVMLMLADGLRLKQIAHRLDVTQGAVKDRINRAKYKLDSRTTIQAVARYLTRYHPHPKTQPNTGEYQ
jgi:DNA-binding NarL/FixJ family response regulator